MRTSNDRNWIYLVVDNDEDDDDEIDDVGLFISARIRMGQYLGSISWLI